MEFDIFFVRDKVLNGSLSISHIPSLDQTAEVLTKLLSHLRFCALRDKLKVSDSHLLQLTENNSVLALCHVCVCI